MGNPSKDRQSRPMKCSGTWGPAPSPSCEPHTRPDLGLRLGAAVLAQVPVLGPSPSEEASRLIRHPSPTQRPATSQRLGPCLVAPGPARRTSTSVPGRGGLGLPGTPSCPGSNASHTQKNPHVLHLNRSQQTFP